MGKIIIIDRVMTRTRIREQMGCIVLFGSFRITPAPKELECIVLISVLSRV